MACFYVKGMPNASEIKTKINLVETYKELEDVLMNYLDSLGDL